jgi:hypothetical protein
VTQLFPGTPLLFASVDKRFLLGAPLGENEGAVPVDNNYPGLVDDILQVLPETRQVFMVLGSGMLNKFWRPQLENEFRRFHDRVTFSWSGDLSFSEILRRCADLPSNSAIIYLSFGTDASGTAFRRRASPRRASRQIECAVVCTTQSHYSGPELSVAI